MKTREYVKKYRLNDRKERINQAELVEDLVTEYITIKERTSPKIASMQLHQKIKGILAKSSAFIYKNIEKVVMRKIGEVDHV